MSARVMGILNVTPDSFSDGGQWLSHDAAVAHGRRMILDGAAYIDVGGESTRPGAPHVSVDEECSRVLPVITSLARYGVISIDTRRAEVAEAAVAAGATIINDISASLWPVAAAKQVSWIAMHMQGTPTTMQDNPHYDDVVGEVTSFLFDIADQAVSAGVPEVMIDPGIGFGKTSEHNCALLANLEAMSSGRYKVVVGTSRKGFLGTLTKEDAVVPSANDRLEASLATAVMALMKGASIVRVHDVKETVRAARVVGAVMDQTQAGVLQ